MHGGIVVAQVAGDVAAMSAKRPPKKAPAKAGAGSQREIASWAKKDGLLPYPESVRAAGMRLLQLRTWPAGLGMLEFRQAVYAYDQMQARGDWDRMPQREQDEWKTRFESVTAEFLDLIKTAPCPPSKFGFPIRDVLLLHAVSAALGKELPPAQSTEWWRAMSEYESAFDRSGLNLTHAIQHFRQQQRADWGPPQTLAKPRDEGSDRVFFAITLWRYTELDDRTIADIATQMLGTSVEAADVYRWTVGYSKRKRERISKKAHKSSFTEK